MEEYSAPDPDLDIQLYDLGSQKIIGWSWAPHGTPRPPLPHIRMKPVTKCFVPYDFVVVKGVGAPRGAPGH